jgi:hypothetical protein
MQGKQRIYGLFCDFIKTKSSPAAALVEYTIFIATTVFSKQESQCEPAPLPEENTWDS